MTCCQKCGGCLVPEIEAYPLPATVRCVQCGWRPKPATIIPIEDSPNRRWESVLCERCHKHNSIRGKEMCWKCWDDHRGKMGAERHAAKLAAGQAARRQREQERL